MFLQILGRTYKIGRAGGVFTGTPRLLGCISRLSCRLLARLGCPFCWNVWAGRLDGSVPSPGWSAGVRQITCWFCRPSRQAASSRLPLLLARFHQPSSSLDLAQRVTGCVARLCLARVRCPTGRDVCSARVLIRHGNPMARSSGLLARSAQLFSLKQFFAELRTSRSYLLLDSYRITGPLRTES
jgi:hypothetical protein